ncbi:MAG: preprotein translocase subunit SecG [Deltaproteobacteria bacterium]|nr:preprotein translocase subunit SecG [Deltaproteobacteria bacterium]
MYALLILVHVVASISLILIVLLQTGKGADMGAAFGGATQTLFGGAGPAPLLGKITTAAAVIFMVTSLSLAYITANPSAGSLVKNVKTTEQPAQSAPAQAPGDQLPPATPPAGK